MERHRWRSVEERRGERVRMARRGEREERWRDTDRGWSEDGEKGERMEWRQRKGKERREMERYSWRMEEGRDCVEKGK